jgi:hypothetical protein
VIVVESVRWKAAPITFVALKLRTLSTAWHAIRKLRKVAKTSALSAVKRVISLNNAHLVNRLKDKGTTPTLKIILRSKLTKYLKAWRKKVASSGVRNQKTIRLQFGPKMKNPSISKLSWSTPTTTGRFSYRWDQLDL